MLNSVFIQGPPVTVKTSVRHSFIRKQFFRRKLEFRFINLRAVSDDRRRSTARVGQWAMGIRSFQKNVSFLHSFPFIENERFVLYVHFRSLKKNVSFSTFISVQYKRTFRSLRSFPFSENECFVRYVHFYSVKRTYCSFG